MYKLDFFSKLGFPYWVYFLNKGDIRESKTFFFGYFNMVALGMTVAFRDHSALKIYGDFILLWNFVYFMFYLFSH